MKTIRPRLSYANVVATLALVLAVGGASALAATKLAKNSVGAKQLKSNAVTGVKVKDGSLSGADIGGPVDSAKRATSADSATSAANAARASAAEVAGSAAHADDADRLGGSTAASFLGSDAVVRVDARENLCPSSGCEPDLLFDVDGLAVKAICSSVGSGQLAILVATAPGGTIFTVSFVDNQIAAPVIEGGSAKTNSPLLISGGAGEETASGQMTFRAPAHTSTFNFTATKDETGTCSTYGTLVTG